ncbi:MAG: ArsR/SmtB family transcription factor [Thermoplasmata archaeon]
MARPKRLMIVDLRGHRKEAVTEFAHQLDLTLSNVSRHLRVIRDRSGRAVGQTTRYRFTNPALSGWCPRIRRFRARQAAG